MLKNLTEKEKLNILIHNLKELFDLTGGNTSYKSFIEKDLHNEKQEWTEYFVITLFNLHNNFVDVHNPAIDKNCSTCIKQTLEKVRNHYPKKSK